MGSAEEVRLLGGRVVTWQPAKGYRSAIDPVLMAAALPAEAGDTILDIGCGAGAATLCLAARCPEVLIHGLERHPSFADLSRRGVEANDLSLSVRIIDGDLLSPPGDLMLGAYDHVMANPPYGEAGRGHVPDDPMTAAALVESEARLADWISFAGEAVRPGGTFTLVHRAERLDEILAALAGNFGATAIYPLWPAQSTAAKRILIQSVKGSRAAMKVLPGLVLHDGSGAYTDAAERVLRHGGALDVTS